MDGLLFRLLYYWLIIIWSLFATFRVVLVFLRHPLTFFYQKKREGKCMLSTINEQLGNDVSVFRALIWLLAV